MKIGLRMLGGLGATALMLTAAPAMAACTWATGNNTVKQLTLTGGAVFAPRDVPIGTTLNSNGTMRQLNFGDTLLCYGTATYNTALVGPVAVNIPVDVLDVPANALLQTNVPGIGLAIYMTGFAAAWIPPPGNPSRFIPFNMNRTAPSQANDRVAASNWMSAKHPWWTVIAWQMRCVNKSGGLIRSDCFARDSTAQPTAT